MDSGLVAGYFVFSGPLAVASFRVTQTDIVETRPRLAFFVLRTRFAITVEGGGQ